MENETSERDWSDLNTLKQHWSELDLARRKEHFFQLGRSDAEELFLSLVAADQLDSRSAALLGSSVGAGRCRRLYSACACRATPRHVVFAG